MKHYLNVLAAIVALTCGIAAAIYYFAYPIDPQIASPAHSPDTTVSHNAVPGKVGKMETVTMPPKDLNGRLSHPSFTSEEFSSNPERDPAEKLVLDVVADRRTLDPAKVQRLLRLIPTLPTDAQTLAMEQATSLIPDREYLTYRNHLLQLAKTDALREAVMNDTLTRGENLRLPNLVEMMRTSKSDAEKQDLRFILQAYLDKDYGPHPAQWETPVRTWVAENAQK